MKTRLEDITFLLLIRLDSIERLENLKSTVKTLLRHFVTNIYILESDTYDKKILRAMLSKKVKYRFVVDSDPILFKTSYFNIMLKDVSTKFVSIVDSDIAIDPIVIINAVEKLRSNEVDVVYPYNGQCFNVSEGLKALYFIRKNINVLYDNICKMELLYKYNLVGGVFLANTQKMIQSGKENEKYYGWGNEDFDRFWRFIIKNLRIYRSANCLFHLCHPRFENSNYRSKKQSDISNKEISNKISEFKVSTWK